MLTLSKAEFRELIAKGKRRNKYGAEKVKLDGITFDSKAEAHWYNILKLRERAGEVHGLKVHPKFILAEPEGQRKLTYSADFSFWDSREKRLRVIDVKGVETQAFKIKRKLMKALLGIEVEIVRKDGE